MTLIAAVVASGLAAGGLVLILRGLVGTTVPLASLVADLHRPRVDVPPTPRAVRLIEHLSGRPTPSRTADLAVCERDLNRYVRDRCTWAALGVAPGVLLTFLASVGTVAVTPVVALGLTVVGALAGWGWARIDLRSDADRARRAFRHALASYLELVTILMAGGAGVETAMFDAVAAGTGSEFRHLRGALTAAQARREPPWTALGQLGARLGVPELEELEASMTLAGSGALVRDSLTAKAVGIRTKDLAQLESEAQARSETMVLPVALMFAGFLLLIGYPALAALSSP